jgi:hypothetical protein
LEAGVTPPNADPIRANAAVEFAGSAPEVTPAPEPVEQPKASDRASWPVVLEGRAHVRDPRRKCYRELGPEYRPGEDGEIIVDAEFVDGDLTDGQEHVQDGDPVALRLELEAAKAEFPHLAWATMTDKITELIGRINAASSITERRALRAELRRERRRAEEPATGGSRLRSRRARGVDADEGGPGRRIDLDEVDQDAEAIKT